MRLLQIHQKKRDCPFVGNLSGLIFTLFADGRAYIALAVGFSDCVCRDIYYRQEGVAAG